MVTAANRIVILWVGDDPVILTGWGCLLWWFLIVTLLIIAFALIKEHEVRNDG